MAYTTPSTQPTGTLITSTMYKAHLVDNIKFLHGPPNCRVQRDVAQAMPTGAWDSIVWDQEDWDNNTMWSSTNPDQVFVRTAGKYLAMTSVGLTNSSGGTRRDIGIFKNSTSAATDNDEAFRAKMGSVVDFPNADINLSVTGMFSMTTSDYLTVQVFHDVGANLNTSTSPNNRPKLAVLWVSS